jgi:protoporphyrinogen oxidase
VNKKTAVAVGIGGWKGAIAMQGFGMEKGPSHFRKKRSGNIYHQQVIVELGLIEPFIANQSKILMT